MSEWKEYKLGEVTDISTGYAFRGDEYEFKGKLRVVRGENVIDNCTFIRYRLLIFS